MTFIGVWIGYAIFGCSAFTIVFLWAVRTRQFTELDRQRYIALKAAEPLEQQAINREPGRIDRYMWLFLLLLCFVMVAAVLWLGFKSSRGGA
jgi:nitrogen fixation-related uncharacterized protein